MEYVLKRFRPQLDVSAIANVHFFEFPEKFYTEKDNHPFSELLYVESGTITVSSENYEGPLKKGELIIHSQNEYHSLHCPEKSRPKVIIIGFACDSAYLKIFSLKPIRLNAANTEKLARIVKEGRNVFAPPYDVPLYNMKVKENQLFGSAQLLKILIEEFLITLIRENRYCGAPQSKPRPLAAGEIANYVNDNYLERISLDELAFIFGTNRSTLCRIFRDNEGESIGERVNRKKTEYAKNELLSTNKTVSEIAAEMNFDSIHYFSYFFKKNVGISPKEYRKKRGTQ